jgi:CRISPR/Cas system-associated protein Cas7 (RAMP superfamily)
MDKTSSLLPARQARLYLEIFENHQHAGTYKVSPQAADTKQGEVITFKVKYLDKKGNPEKQREYRTAMTTNGCKCTCPGFEYSKQKPHTCRHVEALTALNLLPVKMIENYEEMITSIQHLNQAINHDAEQLEQRNKENAIEIEKLENELYGKQKEVNACNEAITSLDETIAQLRAELASRPKPRTKRKQLQHA